MYRAQPAHHQEINDANCTYAASGILMMSGLRSKHVKEFNLM
jgi:hypothetical protein